MRSGRDQRDCRGRASCRRDLGTAGLAVDSDAPASAVAAAVSAASAASSARPDGDAGSRLDLLDDDASAWRSKLTRARLKCHTGRRRDRSRNSLRELVHTTIVRTTWRQWSPSARGPRPCGPVLEVQATVGDGPSSKLGVFELVVDVPCGVSQRGRGCTSMSSASCLRPGPRSLHFTELELRQANVVLDGPDLGLAVDVLHVVHDPGRRTILDRGRV